MTQSRLEEILQKVCRYGDCQQAIEETAQQGKHRQCQEQGEKANDLFAEIRLLLEERIEDDTRP